MSAPLNFNKSISIQSLSVALKQSMFLSTSTGFSVDKSTITLPENLEDDHVLIFNVHNPDKDNISITIAEYKTVASQDFLLSEENNYDAKYKEILYKGIRIPFSCFKEKTVLAN